MALLLGLSACAVILVMWSSDWTDDDRILVQQIPDDSACMACHNLSTPFIVDDHLAGEMGEAGIRCTDCHFAEPTDGDAVSHNGFTISTTPSPGDCSRCHQSQVTQFESSKHFVGWTKMEASARYLDIPVELRLSMCEGCHNIGKVHADGTQGKCDSCHTRHSFSSEEARKPESCGTCHMGPDHPQIEAYLSSKHGVIYSLDGDLWDWSNTSTFTAPVCTTCHQPGGTHDVDIGITIGGVSGGSTLAGASQPFPLPTITSDAFEDNRSMMVSVCSQCHSESFALEHLLTADSIKNYTDGLVGEARNILIDLYDDGLLDPMPADRPPNPVTGYNLTLMGHQTYSNTSGIETLFFEMYKYHGVTTWKGAYHFSPDYTHWFGWAEVNHDLELIKAEDRLIRQISALEPETAEDENTGLWALGIAAVVIALISIGITLMRKGWNKQGPPNA